MQLRYLDDILESIEYINSCEVVSKQHAFVEAIRYYNGAISNALKKIKDEYKEDPQSIENYSDIDLKLILDQLDQLRRDFEYEENQRKTINKLLLKESFHDFMNKANQTVNEIEDLLEKFGLDIKIVYSADNYYQFDEIKEQLLNEMPEEDSCFDIEEEKEEHASNANKLTKQHPPAKVIRKTKTMENLISKRFWLDNFGETPSVDFFDFFEKFKSFVFETEKTNIDDTYYETLGRYLEFSKTLKVFLKDWNMFFTTSWSNYDFRKNFFMSPESKHSKFEVSLPNLQLNYESLNEEEKKTMKKFKISINANDKEYAYETNENNKFLKKNILRKPLIFGRRTKAYTPDVFFTEDKDISNKHFQISAYNNLKGSEGYYLTDLSSCSKTGIELTKDSLAFLDEGNIIEIDGESVCVTKVYPRYKEDPEVQGYAAWHIPTRVPLSVDDVTYKGDPFILLNIFDEEGKDLERIEIKKEVNVFLSEKQKIKNKEGDEAGEKDETGEKETDLLFEENINGKHNLAAIRLQNGKWSIKKLSDEKKIMIYLVNKQEYNTKQTSWGFKLRNGMKICCGDNCFTVN